MHSRRSALRPPATREGANEGAESVEVREIAETQSALLVGSWSTIPPKALATIGRAFHITSATMRPNSSAFPVRDGDVAQARLRAALSQRSEDRVVAVTEDAYIRVRSGSRVGTHVAVER